MANEFTRNLARPADAPVQTQIRSDQVLNNTGGFVFTVSDKDRLTRFLVLGTAGGTYYVNEQKLTKDNATFIQELIARDEQLVIDTVLEISESGRAFRNSPAIFTVACLGAFGKDRNLNNLVVRVCRTATHLFEFATYVKLLGGWGPSKRRAVAYWYERQTADQLAYQVVKYRQREGYTHRDILRLAHPALLDAERKPLADFILGKDSRPASQTWNLFDQELIRGFKFAQEAQTMSELDLYLSEYPNLPWEAVPTQFHKEARLWKHLFHNGQLRGQALVRNITRLARLGMFDDLVFAREYANALTDTEMMRKTRLHPMQYLLATVVHERGQRNRTGWGYTHDWTTSTTIQDALNEGYHKAFAYVEPANKRTLLAVDVSSSMSSATTGTELTAAQVAAAMAMTIARTEPYTQIMGFAHEFKDLGITGNTSLSSAMQKVQDHNFGSTNISLPMTWALERKMPIDTFIVLTDNEVNRGGHPHQALQTYRNQMGIPAKLIVVAATPTQFTVADPTDRGMLDVCGADSNLPTLIANFSGDRL